MNSASTVPTIDVRERIPQAAIDDVVEQIVEKFKPLRIILFGSYARGKPQPESDLDLLVIMKTTLHETEQALRIHQGIDYLFGLDLLVYTPEHLAQRLEWGDSFLQEAVEHGKVLYEATDD